MQSKSLSNKSKISKSSFKLEGSKDVEERAAESSKNNEAPMKKSLKQSIAADSDRKLFKANNDEEE